LQRLPLGYFQRTRAGQTIARVISDTDQVKTAVSAALASLLQNVVVIIVYVVILFGLSVKLTMLSLLLAPVLLLIIRPMINRLRRRSRELAAERGEVTSHVGEMIASAKLVRAYVAEAFELVASEPVLRDVELEVKRGQIVASVGPSGAGKTTLVDLLPRFYEPTRGAILMDSVPLTNYTRTSVRKLMGIVSQETVLLNDTVLANVAYGLKDVPLEQVRAAARAANADEFIMRLPEGYATVLGERGTRLSG